MTTAEQLIARGEHRKEMQIARNLLSNGFDVDTVSENTGLDIELLQKLKEEVMH